VLGAVSLVKFPPLIAASILTGTAIGLANLYSIVRLVEALTGAAQAGRAAGRAGKAFASVLHVFKLGFILAILLALVYLKLTNLFALLVGFTVVLIVNLLAGFAGLKE